MTTRKPPYRWKLGPAMRRVLATIIVLEKQFPDGVSVGMISRHLGLLRSEREQKAGNRSPLYAIIKKLIARRHVRCSLSAPTNIAGHVLAGHANLYRSTGFYVAPPDITPRTTNALHGAMNATPP